MSYTLEPTEALDEQCRLVLHERLALALEAVEAAERAGGDRSSSTVVHDARKRCKEARAAARLIRPSVSRKRADRFDREVGRAARQLAALREDDALLAAAGQLETIGGRELESAFDDAHLAQLVGVDRNSIDAHAPDGAFARAREHLLSATEAVDDVVAPLGRLDRKRQRAALTTGIETSYGAARRLHRSLGPSASEERLHDWRTAVKRLWYHVRLLEGCAPSVLAPLAIELHDLGEALGDHHDLAMLVERVEQARAAFDESESTAVIDAARAQQYELAARARRLGSSLLVERPDRFAARIGAYWKLAQTVGPEIPAEGTVVADDEARSADDTVERERKFLVEQLSVIPDHRSNARELRQGYLAVDGAASVRIRDDDGERFTMTVKLGRGAVRTEIEWPIDAAQFAAVWPHTEGRRVNKTRSIVPIDGMQAEVDVFHDGLDGLVIVEVEFDDDDELTEFEPPSWFGPEVTDDPAYSNAALASAALVGDATRDRPWRPPSGPRREVGG